MVGVTAFWEPSVEGFNSLPILVDVDPYHDLGFHLGDGRDHDGHCDPYICRHGRKSGDLLDLVQRWR